MKGFWFPGFFQKKTGFNEGIRFPGFFQKKPDLTEPDRLGLNRFPIRFG